MSNEQEKMLQSCYMLADDSDESNSDFEIEFIGIPSEDAGTSSEDADTSSEDADRVAFQPFHAGAYCVADGVLQPGFEAMAEEDFAAEEEVVAYSNDLWAMSITGPQQPGAGDAPLASTSSYEAVASTSREEPVASTSRHRGHRRGIRGCRGRGISSSCGSSGENVGVTRSAWSRGEPLVECFPTDEDLPQPLREEIIRLNNKEHSTPRRKMKDESMEDNDVINDIYVSVSSEEYVWKPMDEWHGEKETFLNAGSSGPTRVFEDEYDAFRSFWDDTLLQHIADETNRYARTIQSDNFQRDWFPTNIHEILMLFAFWMVLGIHSLPSIKSCYSKNILLRTDIFRLMFTQDRYFKLNRAFHLGNGSHDANNRHSVLAPMGPVLDVLNSKFKENYQLQQDICIDESLILWKGALKFSQYIKSKSAKLGIKMYQLCESSTSYLWSFFVYAGRETTTSTAPSSFSTVIKLVEPLLDLGHVLYLDNWFNTPTLARYLKRRKTDCVGTLRLNRRNVPAIIQKAPLSRGQFLARQCGDVMVCSFHDHRPVACISTFHDVTQIQRKAKSGRSSRFLLKLNDDYNHNMGGVDHLDQMLVPYLIERKQCAKWNRKLFKRLLNISIQNARILLERSRGTRLDVLSFRTMLGQSIIDRHRGDMPQRNPQNTPQRPCVFRDHFPEGRLTERHFIRRIPITQEMRDRIKYSNNLGRRECVWCTAHNRKAKKTVYECEQCEMALCLKPCFKEFHTVRF